MERKLSNYPTAVVIRVNPDERRELHERAEEMGFSLQNYARWMFGLPLPTKPRKPRRRADKIGGGYSKGLGSIASPAKDR